MREFDVVIFGASGYTGQHIAVEWAKTYGSTTKWALAGRSKEKLEGTKTLIMNKVPDTKDIPILIANALDELSLKAMCESATLVINCTGPFRRFGEPVVKSCVVAGTHYVDISGEPQFIETMMLRYGDDAKKNASVVVSACGFDSIPSDMGTIFTTQQFPNGGACSSIEAFISSDGKRAHATTYECIVLGLAAVDELKQLRRNVTTVSYMGPKLKLQTVGYDERVQKYVVKFPGADASIVRNSQRYLAKKNGTTPVRFAIYATFASVWTFALLFMGGVLLFVLGKFEAGRSLLIQYPHVFTFGYFSHEGPTDEELSTTTFDVRFFGKGYKTLATSGGRPDWQVVTSVHGPEPGYVATSRMVTRCAKVILDGHVVDRGVLTTASAFANTPLISELNQAGITFRVVCAGPV
ncbi:hypothetical protein H310_13327 [Aphanomyces invadans]|uniref:Saccharopine dehydrogenase NADP binding domain-containing protein n=2 Tax=Aphanomyces invadans TaxID=157072 RepID=A0A024TFU6_9STRA|nr:hypothetical protein H310_13327 [Aphanomyces invadans]ETV92451.1 hypothetical protein H310_13327 [Aphanomyces invadans]|eukprot:XP_008879002.1 hypothetical protein H310_13327 [Aphanomyces invadans]